MTIERKLLSTSPSGGATDVAKVFSTHLYTGTGSNQTINNGIDLSGEGGMVWLKSRSSGTWHKISDTERGANKLLFTNDSLAQSTQSNTTTGFNSNGFSLGAGGTGNYNDVNTNGRTYASWTFRKAPKFFDVVTWSGNGVAGRQISHSLGSVPAMIITKTSNDDPDWKVYHSALGNAKSLKLNQTTAQASDSVWNSTTPTDTVFTVGSDGDINSSGRTYVAYLFADNSSEDADDQMIRCGSYTTDGSGNATIDLGWEPQFVITKKTNGTSDWNIWDTMRGWNLSSYDYLRANAAGAETGNANYGNPTATGFTSNGVIGYNSSGIYMAIRAPMMVEPEAATDVFAIDTRGSSAATADGVVYHSNFPVDMTLARNIGSGGSMLAYNRSRADRGVFTNTTAADSSQGGHKWDSMHGFDVRTLSASTAQYAWMWKRAKGFMDVINYIGTGSARTLPHSLGVVPEMMWVRNLTTADSWQVYAAPLGNTKYIYLNENYFAGTNISRWNNTTPTASVITVGSTDGVNRNTDRHTAYLFATLAGISKCGSYTGNGSYQTISCGFSAGSRFVLIKRTNGTNPAGDWYFWDSVRGISAGNDPHLSLNTNAGQVTNDDSIDPANSGFIVNQVSATNINVSSGTYIFYAIA